MSDPRAITVSGKPVVSGSIWVPWSGRWIADLDYGDTGPTTGQATLEGAGLSLLGTFRAANTGTWLNVPRVRLAGGYGGWQQTVPARHYHSDAGVSSRLVLEDVARECGEKIELDSDVPRTLPSVGYVRAYGPGAGALRMVLRAIDRTWWVRADGVTAIGTRPSSNLQTSAFDLLSFDPHSGVLEIACDALLQTFPGAILTDARVGGARRIVETEIRLDKGVRVRCATEAIQ